MRSTQWICLFYFITADLTLAIVTDIQVHKDPEILLEGGNITITCNGTCSNGPCVHVDPGEGIFTNVQRDDNRTYTCTVMDDGDSTTTNKTTTFDVHYGPDSVNIYHKNTSTGDELKVIVGESTTLYSILCMRGDCSSCELSWKGPARVPSKVTDSSLTLFAQDTIFSKKNSGKFTCTGKNIITNNELTETFHLIVQYSPKVTLTWNETSKTLTCIPIGIPTEYRYYMEHWFADQMIRNIPLDISDSEGTYTFSDFTYQETGTYRCIVNNGIKSGGMLNRTASHELFIEDKPVIADRKSSYNVSKGDPLEIRVDVYARPNDVTVELLDSKDQAIIIDSSKASRMIQMMTHSTTVEVNGTRFVLKLTGVLEEYFDKPLKVRFENSMGIVYTNVTLYPEGAPDKPDFFLTTETTHDSVKFKLVTGFFNGSPQTLVIEYKKKGITSEWSTLFSKETGTMKNDLFELSINGLEAEATYEFKAYAHNEFGRSIYTDVIEETLKARPVSSSTLSNDFYIAIIVMSLIIGIIVIVLVILLIVRKRTRESPEAPAGGNKTTYKPSDIVVTDLSASNTVRATVIRKATDIITDSNHQKPESGVNDPSSLNTDADEAGKITTSELELTGDNIETATPGQELTDVNVETATPGQDLTEVNVETATPGQDLTEVNVETATLKPELKEVNVEAETPGQELKEANIEAAAKGSEHTEAKIETATLGPEIIEVNKVTASSGPELTEVSIETAIPGSEQTRENITSTL